MEAFSQGWMCRCEMKLLLRKRDCKRFCRIRLHFQISLLNGIDAQVGQPAAAAVWVPSLQASARMWIQVVLYLKGGRDPHRSKTPSTAMEVFGNDYLGFLHPATGVGCSFIPWEMNNIFFACLFLGYTWWGS